MVEAKLEAKAKLEANDDYDTKAKVEAKAERLKSTVSLLSWPDLRISPTGPKMVRATFCAKVNKPLGLHLSYTLPKAKSGPRSLPRSAMSLKTNLTIP